MERRVLSYYRQYQLDRFVGTGQIDQFKIRRFEKGETICELDQPIDTLHFFVEGWGLCGYLKQADEDICYRFGGHPQFHPRPNT